jgi:4-methyl-5(b-hydroxyethyl)-thiazole monophosphate biosynthesis
MSKVCVLFADGFEEIEAITIVDILRRAEVDVTTVGIDGTRVQGSHSIVVEADKALGDVSDESWDMVILPGGLPGATNLRDHPDVQQLLKTQSSSGGRLAAICAAPIALGAAGVLEGKRATSYPGFEAELIGADCVEDRVVVDGNVITSRGPGTSIEFALTLVSELRGAQVAAALRQGMLVD